MKKILLILLALMLTSCVTLEQKKKWAEELGYVQLTDELKVRWARELGFILPSEVVIPDAPTHELLPHPVVPMLDTENITTQRLMEQIILLSATIEKFAILVEIYEREYIHTGIPYSNENFKGMTLEELKLKYLNLLGVSPD